MANLSTNIQKLNRVGKSKAKTLKKLNIKKVKDLIYHFPNRHKDFSTIFTIKEFKKQKRGTIKAKIKFVENHRSYKTKMTITEAIVSDNTDSIKIVWFNQSFIKKVLKKGKEYFFSGEIESDSRYGSQMKNPVFEKADKREPIHTGRLVPVYPATSGISQKQIRFLIHQALIKTKNIKDWLPEIIKDKYNLMDLKLALNQIHFPQSKNWLKRAKQRLKFNELFLIHARNKIIQEKNKQKKAPSIDFKEKQTKKFVKKLSFDLTNAQKKTSWEIIKDLQLDHPMNRLLEGDVGSGKTIVAMMGILNVVLNDYQVAYMAPTEILAKQHFSTLKNNLNKFLEKHPIALLTNNYARIFKNHKNKEIKKDNLIKKIKKGEISIIIGTHALIQEKIKFKKLALTIVDEQHRFGVKQRAKLTKKSGLNSSPHFLSMSATPIPRSVALTLYGDLDLSIIDELPPERKPVETKIVKPKQRQEIYNFIKLEIKKGRQIFVVCPLIDPSDKLGVKSVTKEYEKLNKDIFPEFNIGLLHGKLKNEKKQKTIENFEKGKIDILVSTTVVEVGIDIPNASIMVIEGAERFGLAQLHQLRGRIGRDNHKSYCFLFTNKANNQKTLDRLNALLTSKNGFELAKKDLKIRGPGEVFGQKQAGFTNSLKVARLSDVKLIEKTKQAVDYLFQIDPKIKNYPELEKRIEKVNLNPHLE